jgi:hypothetical protein
VRVSRVSACVRVGCVCCVLGVSVVRRVSLLRVSACVRVSDVHGW